MPNRTLTDHVCNPANDRIVIEVTDAPGAGGASHQYLAMWPFMDGPGIAGSVVIRFQNGPIAENGVNGVTQEALLAIVIDRLRSFQAGPYSCRENALALTKCEEALMWLQKRTRDRMRRGVEGTMAK